MKKKAELKNSFVKKLFSASGVVITPHVGPDGDAVASTVSLSFMLKDKNIPSIVLVEKKEDFYKEYNKLKVCINITEPPFTLTEELDKNLIISLGSSPIHIYVDCSQKNRIGKTFDIITSSKIIKDSFNDTIAIDHHENPDKFIESFIDKDAPSTGNLMFDIMTTLYQNKKDININLATSIYYAIASDTDNFRHLNTEDANTFENAKVLVELGANPSIIFNAMHGGRPLESVEYMAKVLGSLKTLKNNSVLIATDDKNMFKLFGREKRPSNSIYDTLLGIQGAELVGFLKYKEEDNLIEGSLRVSPNSTYQAHIISRLIANGGGHEKAAGFTFSGTMDETFKALKDIINTKTKEIKK